ncbi:MAG: SPOR domain-containing protein [Bacteroidaceae bacterium]|nr:SPOR domain-containing protein [Bacteroidaceae bacterium]
MNQFPILIEYLLLNHDYVVIPTLGTFIVQQMDARRNEDEEVFLPPYRSVRFNAELVQDDGLLRTSICSIYNVSDEQAGQMLGTWIDEFTQMLDDEGCIDFGTIGLFTRDKADNLIFQPQESGVTTPDYYGLDAFHFRELQQAPRAKVVPMAASMEADEKEITIRINRRIANFAVAACAAFLLFVVFNLPPMQDQKQELRSSLKELFVPSSHTPAAEHKTTTAAPSSKTVETNKTAKETTGTRPATSGEAKAGATADMPAQVPAEKTEPQSASQPAAENGYVIVLASAIPERNAQKYVCTLAQRGFVSARIVKSGSMLRVVVGRYASEGEASEAAREIRRKNSEYKSAWVHHFK